MKPTLIVLTLAIFALRAPAQEVLDGIAAVVNEDVITFSQVRELIGPMEAQVRKDLKGEELTEKIKEIRLKAINDLIDRQLILQEFFKLKAEIPPHYLEDRIQTVIREEFGGDRSAFVRTLQAQGYTLDRFRQLEREKMIVQAMRSQNLKNDVIIPETRIREAYEKSREDYSEEDLIKLRMIAIRKAENGSDIRRGMIEEIRAKIVEGAEFQDLAKMYDDTSYQDAGGDYGWVNRRTLNESLAKIAFALKPGQISQIIELGNSYYLLLVEAKKNGTTKPFAQVRDEIQARLIQEERQKRADEWIGRLRKKAFVKTY
ncbi:MAG: peptidyl-prolyl cis-trans isomerase [Chthoniobacteraceae bacterium]